MWVNRGAYQVAGKAATRKPGRLVTTGPPMVIQDAAKSADT